MKAQWRTMFFACCLAFMLLPITAMSAELPDDAASVSGTASSEAPDKTGGGDYQNATDYFVYGNSEFFCNYDDEDKLYVLDKSTGDERVAMNEHIISLVTYRNNLYAIAYREDSAYMIRMNLNSLAYSQYEPFSGLVTSMARRGNTIYFATDDGIESLNLDNHSKSVFLEADRVTMLYFSDSDSLKYYTEDGLENIYSFSRNAVISENDSSDQATLLGGGYTPRLTAPTSDNPYYTTLNVFHKYGYGMFPNGGNCTCYAFGRSYENLGSEPSLSHGNAGLWYGQNKSYPANSSASNPALGAVTVWSSGGAGHVAVVEVIDGNQVTTSESGWKSFIFKTVTRDKTHSNLSASSYYHFLGYIYVCGENPPPPDYTVPGRYRVTASVGLNMRSGAGTGNQSLGVIPNGAELNVTQKSDSGGYAWGYTSYDGKDGWVALNYCEYIGPIPADNGTLDINWMLDGNQVWGEQGHGTVDVYINGSLVADDAPDYCAQWPVGTSYEIKDIRPKDGYSYNGIHSGSRSGTIGGGTVEVWFNFSGIQTGGMTQAGETTFNGNTYRYYSNEVTWYTAKRFCEEQGGHLAAIASAEENERVKSIITANAWIGANDVAQEGTWTWVTGEPFSYQNWASGEPNNVQLDADSQNHMQFYVDGTWDDDAGCVSKPFVCEIEGAHLDVNGYLDGNDNGGLGDYGTVDVYINGSLVADDVSDYYTQWPSGTSYEIKDIKPKDGYSYDGIRSGSRSGTIGSGTTEVKLSFSKIQTGGMTQAGETTFNGNTYRYYSNEVTWYTAKRFCEEQGGHLATIGSAEENSAVQSLSGNRQTWIGGTDADSEGDWRWVSGEAFSYKNWSGSQPDNYVDNAAGCENYLHLYEDGSWNDNAGYARFPFVCEIEGAYLDVNGYLDGSDHGGLGDYGTADVYINGSLVADDVPDYCTQWPVGTTYEIKDIKPKDGCSYDGVRSGSRSGTIGSGTTEVKLSFSRIQTGGMTQAGETTFNGNTYRYYSNEVTWYTAKRFCEEQGGHLAAIASAEENERIKSIIKANAWIGANDVAQEGTWTWVTGESFSYKNWAAEEPNNLQLDADSQNHMQFYVDGTWDDDVGCVSKPFVCEIEAAPAPTLTGISVDSKPMKTVYEIGEKLDTNGMKVSAHYSDGTSEVLNGGAFTVSELDSSSEGTKKVIVTYQGKEADFTVTVNPTAPDDLRIIVESIPASKGKAVDVPVSVSNNKGIAGMSLTVNYDKSVLSLEKITRGKLLEEGSFSPFAADDRAQWYHTANVTGDGVLFTLRFQVSADAAPGNYAVTLALQDSKPTNLSDENANVVNARFIDGTVTIAEGVLGDLTGDNDIGINDVVKLARAVAGAVTLTDAERQLGDVTGDGDIGINDVVKLARYVAGVIRTLREDSAALAAASEEAVIEVGKVQAQPGDNEIAVPVSITQNPGVAGLTLSISYDETALTLSKIVKGAVITDEDGELIGTNSSNVGGKYLMWYYDGGEVEDTGELFTLRFKINEEAESDAEYPVRLSLKDGKEINFSDMDSNIIPVRFVDGSVTFVTSSKEAVIEVGKVQARPGENEIAVPVSITQNPGVAGFTLSIFYDETALTLSKIVKGAVITDEDGELIGTNSSNVGEKYLMWYYDGGEVANTGELFTLQFKTNEATKFGVEYPVRLSLKDGKEINFADMDSNIVPVRFVDGSVTLSKAEADKLEVYGRYIELLTADISFEGNHFTVTLTQRDNASVPENISAWLACYNEHGKMMNVTALPNILQSDGLSFSGSAETEGNWVLFILDEYFSPVTAKFQLN